MREPYASRPPQWCERVATPVTPTEGVRRVVIAWNALLGDARERVAVLVLHLLAETRDVDVHRLLVRPGVLAHLDHDLEALRARVLADVRVLQDAVRGRAERAA